MKRNTQHYSQNFLRSPLRAQQLLKLSSIRPTETVYDIGAGSGIITSVLSQYCGRVVAVEFEPRAAATLRRNVATYERHNVTVLEQDILTLELPKEPYSVFANIPFHISAGIVRRFFNSQESPRVACLIVQRQFGQKLVSSDTKRFTSQLGMLIGAEYSVKILKNLQKSDFKPAPAVDTVLIELKKRSQPLVPKGELRQYQNFTERCFNDPRFLAKQNLAVIGATPGLSPSRLSISQWVLLFNARRTSLTT